MHERGRKSWAIDYLNSTRNCPFNWVSHEKDGPNGGVDTSLTPKPLNGEARTSPGSDRPAGGQEKQRVCVPRPPEGWQVAPALLEQGDEPKTSVRPQATQRQFPRPIPIRGRRGTGSGTGAVHRTANQDRPRGGGQRSDHWRNGGAVHGEGGEADQEQTPRRDHRGTVPTDPQPMQTLPQLLQRWTRRQQQARPPGQKGISRRLSALERRENQ